MRSRYCAYVLQLGDYLLATWHHSTRPGAIDFDDAPKWLGLTVKSALSQKKPGNATLAEQEEAIASTVESIANSTVEFIARYKIAGRAYRLHETSRFVRENGRWFYLDGEIH